MEKLDVLLSEFREEEFLDQVRKRLAAGEDPMTLVKECQAGMERVGKLFEEKEYFVSDLVMSADMFNAAMNEITPHFKGGSDEKKVKVVLGTAEGDIHDIGKNIVATLLRCNGFDVIDIGVDAPAEKFINAIKESGARIVGISALLTVTFPSMKKIIDAFKAAGLRSQLKIMVGGGPVDETVCKTVGADAYGKDAMEAVSLAKKMAEEVA